MTTITPTATTKFNPASPAYLACFAAQTGNIENLQALYLKNQEVLFSLATVTPDGSRFTPLHLALHPKSPRFQVIAWLVNRAVSWTIVSEPSPSSGKSGISSTKALNKISGGLSSLLEALVNSPDSINLEGLAKLLTDPNLSTERRREALENKQLLLQLSQKLGKENALFVVASLMVGSYQWKGGAGNTDFAYWKPEENGKVYPSTMSTNCYEMIQYVLTLLGGSHSIQTNHENYVNPIQIKLPPRISTILNQLREREPAQNTNRFIINQFIAESLGLISRSEQNTLNPSKKHEGLPLTQVLFFEIEPGKARGYHGHGYIHHYGILLRTGPGDYLVHISETTRAVVVEPAQAAIARETARIPTIIYTATPPF